MSNAPLAVGIDFGGTSVKIGIIKEGALVGEETRIDPQIYDGAAPLIAIIHETIEGLRQQHPGIEAIGVGVPGFVDFPNGMIHNLTNVAGWERVYLKRRLSELCNLPVTVDNDANCMAYAEWKRGSGRGLRHLVALTLGTGVGGGLVVNGEILRGANFVAGELGQTSIDYQGAPGAYQNRGSLEDYIGNQQITELAQETYRAGGVSKSRQECEPLHLAQAAESGDVIALAIWDEIAQKLATALMNCCWLINPEAFVIGGGVANAGPLLFEPLEKYLRAQLSPPFHENLRLLPARFGNEAGMIGAATMALEDAGFPVTT